MAKRTEEQWWALFQQHDESGLTAAAFCRNNKLCPKYFSLRRKQLSGDEAEVPSSPLPFVPARLSAKPPAQDKGLITFDYLNRLFEELPKRKTEDDITDLLPWNSKTS